MAILITTSILSLRGLPSEAKYGVQSIFYYLFAAIMFLLPFSLVCAELASTDTRSGGLYRWVSEAFGPRWGWTAMYLEWQTIVIWFPTVLMFGAASLAYIFWPESFDAALASNKFYTLAVAMLMYWLATFNAFRGQRSANLLSTYGGTVGTIIPGIILICLGTLVIGMVVPAKNINLLQSLLVAYKGLWASFGLGWLGIAGALLALILSFLPPSQIKTGSPVVYVGIIVIGVAVFVAIPLIVYRLRKPSWRNPDLHFYPFDWQIEGREPNHVSKWAPGYQPTEEEVEEAETGAISRHGTGKH